MPRTPRRFVARAACLLLGVVGLAGCMELLAPASEGGDLRVEALPDGILAENMTTVTLEFRVDGASRLSLAPGDPPCGPGPCHMLEGGEAVRLDGSDIPGWGLSNELHLAWWTVTVSPDGERIPGVVHERAIPY